MFGLLPRRREKGAGNLLVTREYPPFDLLRREFTPLFNRIFAGWPIPFEPPWEMTEPWGFTVEEKEKEIVVRAEVPGFEASELEVHLAGELLTIRAEHKEETKAKGEVPVEPPYGLLERIVTLPAGIVPEKVEACYHNGVLEVHVPRTPEAMPRSIEVKT
jgi:HSP20 family protein